MRKIPDNISDPAITGKLTQLGQKIEAKMAQVNGYRDTMKKTGLAPAQLEELKKLSTEIDLLDQEWKTLAK